MTNNQHTEDTPVPAHLAVVAAFLDGEEVNCEALKDSLAAHEARDYLIDLLILRRSVAHMGPMTIDRATAQRPRPIGRWLAAAMILIATVTTGLAGYAIGTRGGFVMRVESAPSSVEAVIDGGVSHAPRPTEVIRLQPGIDWHQGGK